MKKYVFILLFLLPVLAFGQSNAVVDTVTEDGTFVWPEWVNIAILILGAVITVIKMIKPNLFDRIVTGRLVAKAEAVFNVGKIFLQSVDKDSEEGVAISAAEKERLRLAIEDLGKVLGK